MCLAKNNQCFSFSVLDKETFLAYMQIMHIEIGRYMRKPAFCICQNRGMDQLRANHAADQHLCFRYIDSTIPLLPKSKISSF